MNSIFHLTSVAENILKSLHAIIFSGVWTKSNGIFRPRAKYSFLGYSRPRQSFHFARKTFTFCLCCRSQFRYRCLCTTVLHLHIFQKIIFQYLVSNSSYRLICAFSFGGKHCKLWDFFGTRANYHCTIQKL